MNRSIYLFILIIILTLLISCSSQSAESTKRKDASIAIELANLYRADGYSEGEYNTLISYINQYSDTADSQVSYNLASYYFDNGQYDKTIELCEKNYEIYKAHTRFLKLEYFSYLRIEKYDMAAECFAKIVDIGDFDENEALSAYEIYDKAKRNDLKQNLVDKCFDKGFFSKKIVNLALALDNNNIDYQMLSLYAK